MVIEELPPLPRRLPASKLKMGALAAGSAVFVAIGIFLLPRDPGTAWGCILFFWLVRRCRYRQPDAKGLLPAA
jgi:hypothetical protein